MSPPPFRPTFRNPFHEGSLAQEVDDEIAHHIECSTRDLVAGGLSEAEARRKALARFGNRGLLRDRSLAERRRGRRRSRRLEATQGLAADLRTAVRRLRRRPGFALVCVAVLAMGIGSSATVIAVLDSTLFRPPPYPEPDRVVHLFGAAPPRFGRQFMTPANYFDLKAEATVFSAMSTTISTTETVFTDGPRRFEATSVESEYFDVIGIEPSLGRRILPDEETPGSELVTVLSHSLWRSEFGGDSDVVGSALRIGSESATVVGVMPPRFEEEGLLLPFRGDRSARGLRGDHVPIARLRDGIDIETAEAQTREIMARITDAYPAENTVDDSRLTIDVTTIRDSIYQGDIPARLAIIGAIVTLFLLVVCVTVAGLLLAHTVSRQRELSVRAALGAGRLQLVREVLTENGVLAAVGLIGGVATAYPLLSMLKTTAPPGNPWLATARIDERVLLACVVVTLVVWLASGLLPALAASRPRLATALNGVARTSTPRVSRTRRALIVAQFTLACAFLSVAATLSDAYVRASAADTGVDPTDMASLRLSLPRARYAQLERHEDGSTPPPGGWPEQYRVGSESHDITDRIVERLQAVPGVAGATVATASPFDLRSPGAWFLPDFLDPATPPGEKRWHRTTWVKPGYFEALDVPLLRGRTFDVHDHADAEPVVIVNQVYADWIEAERGNALGAVVPVHFIGFSPVVQARVVGVVANTMHFRGNTQRSGAVYAPLAQQPTVWDRTLVFAPLTRAFMVRGARDVESLLPALERAVWDLEPEVPFTYARSLESMHSELFRPHQFVLTLVGSFAAIALVLAAAGTFALLAQVVRSRRHELGVRRALGASAADVVTQVLVDGARMAGLGVALGLALSFALVGATERLTAVGRVAASLDVTGWTTLPQVVVVGVLLGSALLASGTPAWFAGRVDPVDAMRVE